MHAMHLPSGRTRCLTPRGGGDLSPTVSLLRKWATDASPNGGAGARDGARDTARPAGRGGGNASRPGAWGAPGGVDSAPLHHGRGACGAVGVSLGDLGCRGECGAWLHAAVKERGQGGGRAGGGSGGRNSSYRP
ncbi:hypothetical protein BS78_03G084900 [Paspalum vaginatum]|nr:hypothetical protein BS78_03G084900 [Paspalum vaginatum]